MILLFDSSAMLVAMHLVDGEQVTVYEWEAGRNLAKDMLKFLREKLAMHGWDMESIDGIGAFRGPGSYTGLRIGITVLNTLAESLEVPIVGEVGDDWAKKCLARLTRGETDGLVIPEYGGEAHITQPKK